LGQLELWHAAARKSDRNRLRYQIDARYKERRISETKNWQNKNKDKYLNSLQRYRKINQEKIRQKNKCLREKYDEIDKEKLRQRRQRWMDQNRSQVIDAQRKRMKRIYSDTAQLERYKERRRRWREANKDRIKHQASESYKRCKALERIKKYGQAFPKKKSWFKHDQPGYLYLMDRPDALKIGITSRDPWERKKELGRWGFSVVDCIGFKFGKQALDLETRLKSQLKAKGVLMGQDAWMARFKGYTEAWSKTDLDVGSLLELFGFLGVALNETGGEACLKVERSSQTMA